MLLEQHQHKRHAIDDGSILLSHDLDHLHVVQRQCLHFFEGSAHVTFKLWLLQLLQAVELSENCAILLNAADYLKTRAHNNN